MMIKKGLEKKGGKEPFEASEYRNIHLNCGEGVEKRIPTRRSQNWQASRTCLLVTILLSILAKGSSLPSESSKPKPFASIQTNLAKKQLEKELAKTKSRSKQWRSERSKPDDSAISSTSTKTLSSVSVEAFLVPRKVNLRLILRIFCWIGMLWSLLRCLQTSGTPFANTIWEILYADPNGSSTALYKPPPGYFPSQADVHLAHMMVAMSKTFNVMIPSDRLPAAGPILGVVFSVCACIGLTYLIPQWSIRFRVFLDFVRTDSLMAATTAGKGNGKKKTKQQPLPTGERALVCLDGASITGQERKMTTSSRQRLKICPLYQSSMRKASEPLANSTMSPLQDNFIHPTSCYFEVNHCRVYCDPKTKACFDGAPTLQNAPFQSLQRLVEDGGLSKKYRKIAQERYKRYNVFDLASPTLEEAFFTRISSPLVIIQFVGRFMSLLEEGMAAMVPMAEALLQHYNDARQSIQSAQQMANEVKTNLQDTSGDTVSVWKNDKNKWVRCTAGDLVPGEIFQFTDATGNLIVPVDALVLKGQCLTNEAVLTGESVAQVKIPLDFQERESSDIEIHGDKDQRLDMQRDRASILFAGTTMLGTGSSSMGQAHGGNLTCLALQTGTYSSKGQLLQALKRSGHVGAISNSQSEKDAMRLMAGLSVCAAVSCGSLFARRDEKAARVSPFRRVIQCSRIILASIPSRLPLALASVAKTCSRTLRRLADVACSEPGSLLTAANVDTVVFDKTGTLTADTQSLSKLVLTDEASAVSKNFQCFLLAGCHSLVSFSAGDNGTNSLIGDPLDKAAFLFSGWKIDVLDGSFVLPKHGTIPMAQSEPVRLWQICSFPFDPNRRLSSSIVLVELKSSKFELWRLTKGSPEAMMKHFRTESDHYLGFEAQTKQLEANGFRSIALGAENLTNDSICRQLFPGGLSSSTENVKASQENGAKLHRSDIENRPLINCGFACFHAAVRPSSRRVINELHGSGIDCIMLTGDSLDAALSVASKVDLVTTRKVVVLELRGESTLVWRKIRYKVDKTGTLQGYDDSKHGPVSVASVQKYLRRQEKGSCSIAAHGPALEHLLNQPQTDAHKLLLRNLRSISVIARATPDSKKKVIDALRALGGRRVMMCGDGVNDVAAIQTADVAAALLNGFGAETEQDASEDIDNERRVTRLKLKDIGSNREQNAARLKQKAKKQEATKRIRDQIEQARTEIDARVAERHDTQYNKDDVKAIVAASFQAFRDERDRARKLQKGGADAARILAEERRKNGTEIDDNELDEDVDEEIKPGEVSLVSPFSCLHPSIDGAEAILREGVATAASALATQQSIALHSLLSCVHLATLYRDGLRYSQKMLFCEQGLYLATDAYRYRASCQPRPRLPRSTACRPPTTMFEKASMFATLGEAVTHLLFMTWAVRYSKGLGNELAETSPGKIGLHSLTPHGDRLGRVVNVLSKSSIADGTEENDEESKLTSFFRRPTFKPNYETNMVFLFSIIQFVISSVVNHQGKPFYYGILESRDYCRACCLSVALVMVCITGIMPRLNSFLDVKPFPSAKSKLVVVCLAAGNALCCLLCHWVANRFLATNNVNEGDESKRHKEEEDGSTAADFEEQLLQEESQLNLRMVKMFAGLMVYFLVDIAAEALRT